MPCTFLSAEKYMSVRSIIFVGNIHWYTTHHVISGALQNLLLYLNRVCAHLCDS
jgi:hypothetical protein